MQAKATQDLDWYRMCRRFGDFDFATCIHECRGHFVKETLHNFGGRYYFRIERGTKMPFWMFWKEKTHSWTITYETVSADVARAWAEKNSLHIPDLND